MSEKALKELLEKLHDKISNYTLQGWRIVDKNEKRLECVLEKGGNFSHTVHAILTLITCI